MKNRMEKLIKLAESNIKDALVIGVRDNEIGLSIQKVWAGGFKTAYRKTWSLNGEKISASKLQNIKEN